MGQVIDFEKYRIEKELKELSRYETELNDFFGSLDGITTMSIHSYDEKNNIMLTLDPETYTHDMYTVFLDQDPRDI